MVSMKEDLAKRKH